MSCFKYLLGIAPMGLLLTGCGMGSPVTVDEVEAKMTEDFSEDGAEVTWVSAEQTGEDENDYLVFLDVTEDDEDSTKMCNVSMTSMSSSYSCQTMTPSVISQAAALLADTYEARGIELIDHAFERTGDDMVFGGDATIRNAANGARALIACSGDQDGTEFNIDCDDNTLRPL